MLEKPLSEFYRHPKTADGHLNKCKECTKNDVREHRADNLEAVQAYDRLRDNLPHRVKARKEYQKTDAFNKSKTKALKKYKEKYPERDYAHNAVNNAVRDGRLLPWPACAVPECNCKPEAHHPDYGRPLDVVWLCDAHHKEVHKMAREIKRNAK